MAKNTQSSQAGNAANIVNTGVSASRDLTPQINSAGQQSTNNANSEIAGANGQLTNASNYLSSANPTYSAEANTGGFTPGQETNYLDRATSGVGSVYSGLEDNANRLMARTGASSGPAALAQIARQGGNAQSSALENANADLNQQENANKLAGSAGLAGLGTASTGIANAAGGLYGTALNSQNTANSQLLQSAGQQITGGQVQYGGASNFGANPLMNYIPTTSFGVSPSGGFTASVKGT